MINKLPTVFAESAPYANEYLDKSGEADKWFFPLRVSDYATEVDVTFYVEYAICGFFGLLIYLLTAYYCVKYRRREGDPVPPHITHNWALEILWTILPTIICFGMFFVGAQGYLKVMGEAPKGARTVEVYGAQWFWQFQQKGSKPGIHKSSTLILEVNRPVQLRMISRDVLHSLFMPGMRSKMDVVPNRITTLNILPVLKGTFNVFCTEYCGEQHSTMITTVKVLDHDEFIKATIPMPQMNPYKSYKNQCLVCHSLNGSDKTGPSWKGLWSKTGKVVIDGKETAITVDEKYLRESIRHPEKALRVPFKNLMTPFAKGQISDVEVTALVEWIKKGTFEKDLKWDLDKKVFVKDE